MQMTVNKISSMSSVGTMPITPSLNINGFFLPEATSVKDFGITFDTNLSFTAHITTIILSANQRVNLLFRALFLPKYKHSCQGNTVFQKHVTTFSMIS